MKETALIKLAAQQMLAAGMDTSQAARELRKAMIVEELELQKGNVCRAARALHVHRNTLSRQMQELGILDVANECRVRKAAQGSLSYSRKRGRPVDLARMVA